MANEMLRRRIMIILTAPLFALTVVILVLYDRSSEGVRVFGSNLIYHIRQELRLLFKTIKEGWNYHD